MCDLKRRWIRNFEQPKIRDWRGNEINLFFIASVACGEGGREGREVWQHSDIIISNYTLNFWHHGVPLRLISALFSPNTASGREGEGWRYGEESIARTCLLRSNGSHSAVAILSDVVARGGICGLHREWETSFIDFPKFWYILSFFPPFASNIRAYITVKDYRCTLCSRVDILFD